MNAEINRLIVRKNFEKVASEHGKHFYETLKRKQESGTYKVRNTANGYMFSLLSADGECLVVSQIYSKPESCLMGIESVKKNAVASVEDQTQNNYQEIRNPKYEVYQDKTGEYRFRLKSKNGQILVVSSGYSTIEECLTAMVCVTIMGITHIVCTTGSNLSIKEGEVRRLLWHREKTIKAECLEKENFNEQATESMCMDTLTQMEEGTTFTPKI